MNTANEVTKLGALVDATNKQATTTAGQLVVMQQQLEATDRPWIKIIEAGPSHPLIFHKGGDINAPGEGTVNLGLRVVLKNVGRSVALDIAIRDKVSFPKFSSSGRKEAFRYPLEQQKIVCDEHKRLVALPFNLFPDDTSGDKTGDDHDTGVPDLGDGTFIFPDLSFVRANVPKVKSIMPMFVGCIDYKIASSGHWDETGFIYQLSRRPPARSVFEICKNVPMSELIVTEFAFGGFYAN